MVKKIFSYGYAGRRKKRQGACHVPRHPDPTPLSQKSSCGKARVCTIRGDRKHCARLAAMGLYPGNEIELVSPANGHECIIRVHGGTISIDKDTTENILVSE